MTKFESCAQYFYVWIWAYTHEHAYISICTANIGIGITNCTVFRPCFDEWMWMYTHEFVYVSAYILHTFEFTNECMSAYVVRAFKLEIWNALCFDMLIRMYVHTNECLNMYSECIHIRATNSNFEHLNSWCTPWVDVGKCNTLQHTGNILQHTATHCFSTHYNTLQHAATYCNILQHTATYCIILQHTATHCNTLQHTATHCNTPALQIWHHISYPPNLSSCRYTWIHTHKPTCTHTNTYTYTHSPSLSHTQTHLQDCHQCHWLEIPVISQIDTFGMKLRRKKPKKKFAIIIDLRI